MATVEERYTKVRRMIIKLAYQFARRYGGHPDDFISEGNRGFMKAVEKYDPSRGAFTTAVHHAAKNCMIDLARKERTRAERLSPGKIPPRPDRFDLGEFLREVSPAAAEAARIALGAGTGKARKIRQKITKRFGGRTDSIYHELKEALA